MRKKSSKPARRSLKAEAALKALLRTGHGKDVTRIIIALADALGVKIGLHRAK
jgi:hypothetical protein